MTEEKPTAIVLLWEKPLVMVIDVSTLCVSAVAEVKIFAGLKTCEVAMLTESDCTVPETSLLSEI